MQSLYYPKLYPTGPVPGFTSSEYPGPYQDYNKKHGLQPGQWGYPTCQQWWSAPDIGLEAQLVHLVGQHSPTNPHLGTQTLSEKVGVWLQKVKTFTHVGSQVTSDDVIARDMLYDVGANSGFGRYYSGWMSINNGPIGMGDGTMHSAITHGAADVAQGVDAIYSTVDRAEISQEIPILQAVLLSFGLTLGPMILVFGLMSGKGITVTFSYYFLIGSLLFMTFIEKFIHYLLRTTQNCYLPT